MKPDTCCETRLSFVCNPGAGGESLVRLRVGEAGHVHRGDRRALPVAAAHRIAADLEAPAEGRQLGKGGVAGRAGLPGLAGVARQRLAGPTLAARNAAAVTTSAARPRAIANILSPELPPRDCA